MRINVVGGGPAGLTAALALRRMTDAKRVRLLERSASNIESSFGIVFSNVALQVLARVDPLAATAVRTTGVAWDHLAVQGEGWSECFAGYPYLGISRNTFVEILRKRCVAVGVELVEASDTTVGQALDRTDLLVVADGTGSQLRDSLSWHFNPTWSEGANWFAWMGCSGAFACHTFVFAEHQGSRWCAHAYPYAKDRSTFIVECSPQADRTMSLAETRGDDVAKLCKRVFARHLGSIRLFSNGATRWRRHRALSTQRWWSDNVVLVGDAAHSLHFSIGSGTRLAMEDSLVLADALTHNGEAIIQALAIYEAERRPAVERFQQAAQLSRNFFESALSDLSLEPHEPFVLRLMTRSGRLDRQQLEARSPGFTHRLRACL